MITLRFLVSHDSLRADAFFIPVHGQDFGVQARFAWIGFDPNLENVAYHKRSGRSVVASDVPILPPARFASDSIHSESRRLIEAVNGAFADVRSAEQAALRKRAKERVDDAVRSVDLFHPVLVTAARLWSHDLEPLESVRLERDYPSGREWIDIVNQKSADDHLDHWQRWYEEKLLRLTPKSGGRPRPPRGKAA